MLHELKYRNKTEISWVLGHLLYQNIVPKKEYDAIITVPLHKNRLSQRKFNQVEKLSYLLQIYYPDKLKFDWVIRNKDTITQTKNKINERRCNITNAFTLKKMYRD